MKKIHLETDACHICLGEIPAQKKKRHSKYCSSECQRVAQKRYYREKPNGETWASITEYVNERDEYTCQDCGKTNKKLYVHHIEYLCNGGSNNPDNLISLCSVCHAKRHKIGSKLWP